MKNDKSPGEDNVSLEL